MIRPAGAFFGSFAGEEAETMRQETDEQKQRAAIGKRAGLVGLLCNFLLAGGKLAVGTLAASMAIFADGLNNLSDGASSLVTLLGFKLGGAPGGPGASLRSCPV